MSCISLKRHQQPASFVTAEPPNIGFQAHALSAQPISLLQDTVADMAKDMRDNRTGSAAASAEELYQFMQMVPIHFLAA